jgi:glycerol-3-phosphate dehydrogenase
MDFVVNEWLPEYFRPNATLEEKLQLQTFLERFLSRNDRIIVKSPSAFLDKIYKYANTYQTNNEIVNLIRNFIKFILLDSNRCVIVENSELPALPHEVTQLLNIPGSNFSSDTYLFESASAIPEEKTIVTTDSKLANQFKDEPWCKVVLLSDFLADY